MNYSLIVKRFEEYLEKFNKKDPKIVMKINHSYHVAELAKILGKRLELKESEIEIVKTLGLLHDIGRFVQYEKVGYYNDALSKIDHGQLAIDYLFQENHIQDFCIPENYYKIFEKAIFNHNKLTIEENLTEEELFFSRFLRDVDKIDIFRQLSVFLEESDCFSEVVSKKVLKEFYEHHLVDAKNIINKSDIVVAQIAYVFDIHFHESYELLKETDNLELYLSAIEVKKEVEEEYEKIKKEVRNYLEERISEWNVR